MKIEVLGNCCATCHAVYAHVKEAASEVDPSLEVNHIENIVEILRRGVMQTPAVIIDDKIVSMGHHLSVVEAKALIEKHLNR